MARDPGRKCHGRQEDLTAAAGHVAGSAQAVTALTQHLGNTIDVQRLRDDVVRLADDVDLSPAVAGIGTRDRVGGPGEIVFIPDEDYDPGHVADAEDEGSARAGD